MFEELAPPPRLSLGSPGVVFAPHSQRCRGSKVAGTVIRHFSGADLVAFGVESRFCFEPQGWDTMVETGVELECFASQSGLSGDSSSAHYHDHSGATVAAA